MPVQSVAADRNITAGTAASMKFSSLMTAT